MIPDIINVMLSREAGTLAWNTLIGMRLFLALPLTPRNKENVQLYLIGERNSVNRSMKNLDKIRDALLTYLLMKVWESSVGFRIFLENDSSLCFTQGFFIRTNSFVRLK